MTNNRRIWTKEEHMIACHVYFNRRSYRDPVSYVASLLHRTIGSINMRFGNYDYFATNGAAGLENGGAMAKGIYMEYSKNPVESSRKALDLIKQYEGRI